MYEMFLIMLWTSSWSVKAIKSINRITANNSQLIASEAI